MSSDGEPTVSENGVDEHNGYEGVQYTKIAVCYMAGQHSCGNADSIEDDEERD